VTRELRVAVLGAGGTIGPAIVRDLAASDEVSSLLLLDRDGDAAAAATAQGGGKAASAAVDARESLGAALEGSDVLVNSASYRVNLHAMRACLEAGCHYVDLGGLYWMTARQLELHAEFERAGLLALLGMGSSPGKTNVMALRAARELAGNGEGSPRLDAVHVSAAGRDPEPPAGFSVPYALETLIDELTMPPVIVRGGEPAEIEPLSPGGVVAFPDPIGEAETIHTLHSELLTFPSSFHCHEGSFRLSLAPELLGRLRELAEGPPEEIARAAREALPPSPRTVSTHVVEAMRDGRAARVAALTRPSELFGLGGGVVSTAAPAAAAVRLIARGLIDTAGALPPERCVDPGDLFGELERRGTTFEVRTEEAARA
jgi:lysine 6-dehydrogenase